MEKSPAWNSSQSWSHSVSGHKVQKVDVMVEKVMFWQIPQRFVADESVLQNQC